MVSKSEIEKMKARLERASPGDWNSYIEGRDHLGGSDFIMTGGGDTRGPDIELSGATNADQDFIAHARQDMEILIAEIERLWALQPEDG